MRSIYWFRRDLRIHDNRALAEAYEKSDEVIAVYVFDPETLEGVKRNIFYTAFLLEALKSLSGKTRVNIFYGDTAEVIDQVMSQHKPRALYTATPLSWTEKAVAQRVKSICARHGVRYVEVPDNMLLESSRGSSLPLNSFTTFYKSWLKSLDSSMRPEVSDRKLADIGGMGLDEIASKLGVRPIDADYARASWARRRLEVFDFKRYHELRDYLHIDGTSRLSHFINLGVVSVREVYKRVASISPEYVRQLAWREYYILLSQRYPWMRDIELKPYMRGFEWENDKHLIQSFIEGRTGYPIIDAGMRQLKKEGWVHNRVRMILASFLVRDLHVDWRLGAELFRDYLIDYDEVLNTGNWQWTASTGVDPLPLRIFNPISQARRYDPLCLYVKRYLEELEDADCRAIHDPLSHRIRGYYEPIVDHYEAVKWFINRVRKRLSEWRSKRVAGEQS